MTTAPAKTPARPRSPLFWPVLGLVLLVVLNVALDLAHGEWRFLKLTMLDGHLYGTPIDIFNQGSRVMLLALGMTLIIATGGVDLSVGSVMAVSGAVAAVLMASGVSVSVAVAAGLGVGLLVGLINGLLVAKLGIQPIVATLALMAIGRGVAQLVTSGNVVTASSPAFVNLGKGFVGPLPFAPLLVGALFVGAHFFLRRSAAGLFVEAVGDNETAARFAGLNAARVKGLTYVFGGFCAGLAGLMATANIASADPYRAGEDLELDAIFAVVVGGTALTGGRFLLLGAFVGALLLQTLTATMISVGVKSHVAPVPKAIVILVVCLMQSEQARRWFRGLFVKGGAK